MELLRKIDVKERLPNEGDIVFTIYKGGNIGYEEYSEEIGKWWLDSIIYWYEPITIELDSENILPVEIRWTGNTSILDERSASFIPLYHKALEAAELQYAQLQEEYDELLKRYEHERELTSKYIKTTYGTTE